jgi:hypothetical protein
MLAAGCWQLALVCVVVRSACRAWVWVWAIGYWICPYPYLPQFFFGSRKPFVIFSFWCCLVISGALCPPGGCFWCLFRPDCVTEEARMGPQEPERRPRGQREREGGPGRPNPSQPRARLPPPGAPGQVRHERDNSTPAAEAAPRNREPIAVVIWHGLQHALLLLGAQETRGMSSRPRPFYLPFTHPHHPLFCTARCHS